MILRMLGGGAILLALSFAASPQSILVNTKPCLKPSVYALQKSRLSYDPPDVISGTGAAVPAGTALKCLGTTADDRAIHAELPDGSSGWLRNWETDVGFQDPRTFFATSDGKLLGYLARRDPGYQDQLYSVDSVDRHYLREALVNGVPAGELTVLIRSVKRIVIRPPGYEIETETNKYTAIDDDRSDIDATWSALMLVLLDGTSIRVKDLPPCVLERRGDLTSGWLSSGGVKNLYDSVGEGWKRFISDAAIESFQVAKTFLSSPDNKIAGILAGGDGEESLRCHGRSLTSLYLIHEQVSVNGSQLKKDLTVFFKSLRRIVVRIGDIELETQTAIFTIKNEPVPRDADVCRPTLFLSDGTYLPIDKLSPIVLEKR